MGGNEVTKKVRKRINEPVHTFLRKGNQSKRLSVVEHPPLSHTLRNTSRTAFITTPDTHIHTRVELKLVAWEEDKARGCVNSLPPPGGERFIVRAKRREREGGRERERERETKTRISWDISNSPGQICRLFVLEAAIQQQRERARARVSNEAVCANLCASSAPCVSKFRSRHPLSLPLSLSRSRDGC